jgi:hypothetical protein
MRRWQEVEEDYPFMASRREHAQSEFTCIAKEKVCKYMVTLYLLYLLFQENKSFGAITICIHPLMYKKPFREQYISIDLGQDYVQCWQDLKLIRPGSFTILAWILN